MKREAQVKTADALTQEKRRWQWISLGLMGCMVLLSLTVFSKSMSTKTIFIPPNMDTTDSKPFWIADQGASPEYYQLTADYVAQLALTTDGKSAPYNISRLMVLAHPSLKGVLKTELDAVAAKLQKENVTQAFYPKEYLLGKDKPIVAIKGELKTWVGDKQISARLMAYRMNFSIDAGRVYLTEFKEIASDTLKLDEPTVAPPAAPLPQSPEQPKQGAAL